MPTVRAIFVLVLTELVLHDAMTSTRLSVHAARVTVGDATRFPPTRRLVEEMLRHNADLVAVQECDHYADFFEPVMAIFGYESVYNVKNDSPCLGFGYYSDGIALFYKADVWELVPNIGTITGHYRAPDGTCVASVCTPVPLLVVRCRGILPLSPPVLAHLRLSSFFTSVYAP